MGERRIKWGNIIIFLLIIAAGVAAFLTRNQFGGGKDRRVVIDNNGNKGKNVDDDFDFDNLPVTWDDIDFPSGNEFIMGLDSWIGGTPVLIGLDREYNRDYGLDLGVEYIHADADRIKALAEGRIQATEMSLPSFMRFQEQYPGAGIIVGITDFSRGADGIVAKTEVKDLNDIEDKTVSYVKNGTGKFILNKFLRLVGLRYQDIEPIERESMSEVIEDLRRGTADVIVSWSPDMNIAINEINAERPNSVKMLITTKEVPNLIPTMLIVNRDYAERNPDKVESFLKTWYASAKHILEKPDKAYTKLAELMNESQEYGEVSKEDVEASFKDVKLMSLNDNLSYFGLSTEDNKVDAIIDDTVETWKRYGDLDFEFKISGKMYKESFLAKMDGDDELLVGVLDNEPTGSNEEKVEFEKQDGDSIEKKTEKVAKVDIPPVYYDSGKATVKAESLPVLDEVFEILSQFPEYYLIVDAHTDSVGSDESNKLLSENRASEVKKYLVQRGVNENRIIARGWGESRLLIQNDVTEEDKAKNRRTEFILTRVID